MKKPVLVTLFALSMSGAAGQAMAQADPLTDPLPRALGQQADRRLDRLEQTVREIRAIVYQGRDTGQAVVVQPAGTQAQVDLLVGRVGDLEETLRRVNGQIDTLSTEIGSMRRDSQRNAEDARLQRETSDRILARLDSIDQQLQARIAEQQAQQAALAADPVAGFDAAMQLYVSGQNRAAAEAFRTWIAANPDAEDAAEANYYLGESLYKQSSYTDAAIAYIAAIRGYPKTPWAPDAMVKLGVSLIETRRNPEACGILGELNTRYPRASTALKTQATQARQRARCS
jgi:tol-pal system protein YbgF